MWAAFLMHVSRVKEMFCIEIVHGTDAAQFETHQRHVAHGWWECLNLFTGIANQSSHQNVFFMLFAKMKELYFALSCKPEMQKSNQILSPPLIKLVRQNMKCLGFILIAVSKIRSK